jgi:S-adenosylmethionine hydrolase
MTPKRPLIALLTDFGTRDFFVGSLKGVLLSINPEVRIEDISHDVPPFDVAAGAFILAACAPVFPSGTIFVAVVDPGVGSERRVLCARTARHAFIAPDNGLLGPVLDRERPVEIREVANPVFRLAAVSPTFEGRDVMAPAAAWLSLGLEPAALGPGLAGCRKLPVKGPAYGKAGIRGSVLYADRFGNLITNIPAAAVLRMSGRKGAGRVRLRVAGRVLGRRDAYASAGRGEVFFLEGSLGLIEISAREASAARKLRAGPGTPVRVTPGP